MIKREWKRAAAEPIPKGKKKQGPVIKSSMSSGCRDGCHASCFKKQKCTCPCHRAEYAEMVNP